MHRLQNSVIKQDNLRLFSLVDAWMNETAMYVCTKKERLELICRSKWKWKKAESYIKLKVCKNAKVLAAALSF